MAMGACMMSAIYSARLVIHTITSAKTMREVWPAVFVRESSTQNVFAGCMHQILYIFTDFQVSERLQEALNFLIITS
jgi:lipid-A-disaccharide synthase-like uncharacterized protein